MKRTLCALTILLAVIRPAPAAENIDQINQLVQAEFRNLAEDLGAALSYKAVIPAKPLGLTGFDLGLEVTGTTLQHRDTWDKASSGTAPSTVIVPKLHIHKGLPLRLDLGAFYTSVPSTNIKLWGGEIRYALIEGGIATPALGLRATYTKLSGVSQLDFRTRGLELSISKGFTIFTPFAGIGRVWTVATPVGVTNVVKEDFSQGKVFLGGNFNLGLVNFAIEGDKTGDATSYSAKFGFRF